MKGIEATLTFLPPFEGGRGQPVLVPDGYRGHYRPHIVIGDPTQRKAIVEQGNVLTEDYLGVDLWSGPASLPFGIEHVVQMRLSYYPNVVYSTVQPGATFTMREGGRIVAFGQVLKTIDIEDANKSLEGICQTCGLAKPSE